MAEGEKANYVTCPQGHKIYVIWSPERRRFGFTCDVCNEHSEVALSPMTGHVLQIKIKGRMPKGTQ